MWFSCFTTRALGLPPLPEDSGSNVSHPTDTAGIKKSRALRGQNENRVIVIGIGNHYGEHVWVVVCVLSDSQQSGTLGGFRAKLWIQTLKRSFQNLTQS